MEIDIVINDHEQYKFLDSKAISGLLTIYVYLILRLFNCCRDECSKRFPDAAQAWSLVSYWPLDHNQSRFTSPHFSNGPASRPLLSESLSRHFLSTISLSIPIFYPPFNSQSSVKKEKITRNYFILFQNFFIKISSKKSFVAIFKYVITYIPSVSSP